MFTIGFPTINHMWNFINDKVKHNYSAHNSKLYDFGAYLQLREKDHNKKELLKEAFLYCGEEIVLK